MEKKDSNSSLIHKCRDEIKKVIKGKEDVIEKVLGAIIAGGHILLEDIPGVGKTTLAMGIARIMSLDYKRIQFTPDVLPGDINGFSMYNAKSREFEYKPGAVFSNLFLADEINRTSPKTQSALLEVMEEGQVTVDGVSRKLPEPFLVIATQNPLGSAGTQRLPESQMDRFIVCLSLGYPDHENAISILKENAYGALETLEMVVTTEEVLKMQKDTENIYVHDSLFDYIVTITEETRKPENFLLGLSPRGSIALLKMSKAAAYLSNRDYLIPEDIHRMLYDVCCHRLLPCSRKKSMGLGTGEVLESILNAIPVPRTGV